MVNRHHPFGYQSVLRSGGEGSGPRPRMPWGDIALSGFLTLVVLYLFVQIVRWAI